MPFLCVALRFMTRSEDGDKELAYWGDPDTGEPLDSEAFEHWIRDNARIQHASKTGLPTHAITIVATAPLAAVVAV